MGAAELLVILLVAVVAFGPKQLPLLARHLGFLIRRINQLKATMNDYLQQAVLEDQLLQNEQKARDADRHYLYTQ